jgi:upstream activation factor subunit UAF30
VYCLSREFCGTAARKVLTNTGRRAMATKKKAARKSAKKSARKPARKTTARKKASKKAAKKRTPSAAFMKPVQPDEKLAAVVGSSPMPRTEVTKKLWTYIKRNGLQDQKNRRNINADDKLRPVFNGRSTVNMFEMTSLVSKHVR